MNFPTQLKRKELSMIFHWIIMLFNQSEILNKQNYLILKTK